MTHELEIKNGSAKMMYAGETPWHNLGVDVGPDAVTSEEAISAVPELGMEVRKYRATAEFNGRTVQSPDTYLCVREDGKVVGTVGERYTVLQTAEAFAAVDSIAGPNGPVRYETAGSLRGGSVNWLLANVSTMTFEVVPGDPVKSYFLLVNTFNGWRPVIGIPTAVRVVCANTERAALDAAKKTEGFRIRHTASVHDRLKEGLQMLAMGTAAFQAYKESSQHLASLSMTSASADTFLKALIPTPESGNDTKAKNRRGIIYSLFDGKGKGADMPGVRGTAWGMLNAVTEYTNHHAGKDKEKRLNSVWFGQGNDLNRRARKLLLTA